VVDNTKKIQELEDELQNTVYNKATQHHIGRIKAKIAKLREAAENATGGASGGGYAVKRSGDGTAILLGFPSAGKSTLLNVLTNQDSEIGAYAFTTLTVVPGLLEYKGAQIQVLDVPGIVSGAAAGRGRGKEVLATMRNADVCLIVLDATRPEELDVLRKEIYDAGIRLDQRKPDVKIIKKAKDGIDIGRTVSTPELDDETIINILSTFRIFNADIVIRTPITPDQFIDCIQKNKEYMPSILVVNKTDLISEKQKQKLKKNIKPDLFISASENVGIEELKEIIFDKLDFIRIYTKEPREDADMTEPLIVLSGSTIRDVANKLHRDFEHKFKFARVSGPSAKFDRQQQGLDHELLDGDVLELHTR
jgi:small GTP-binding protein